MDEWINKMWFIYNGIIFGHDKKEILSCVTTWMDLKDNMPSELSRVEKDKCCLLSLICEI